MLLFRKSGNQNQKLVSKNSFVCPKEVEQPYLHNNRSFYRLIFILSTNNFCCIARDNICCLFLYKYNYRAGWCKNVQLIRVVTFDTFKPTIYTATKYIAKLNGVMCVYPRLVCASEK